MSVTGSILAGVGLAGSIGSAAIGSNAAQNAASTQANAAENNAQLEYKASQNALNFQEGQWNTEQADLAPWLKGGQQGLQALLSGLGIGPNTGGAQGVGYGSLSAPPPTGLTYQNDPGYQARMQLGEQALQQSAASRGNLLTGGTAEAVNAYGQAFGSNEYQNVFNRYETQQQGEYNRLAGLAGAGQNAANTLGQLGQGASNNVTSNLLGTAGAISQQNSNAAAANASGIVGSANAWGGALGGSASSISNLLLLQQLYGQGGLGGGQGGWS